MESQSQIENAYRESRIKSIIRHVDAEEKDKHRRRLQYASIPGVLVGVVGMVWYVTQPYPAGHWPIGLASVIVLAFFLCLPSGVARNS